MFNGDDRLLHSPIDALDREVALRRAVMPDRPISDVYVLVHGWDCLRDAGNLSSASVLLILERTLAARPLRPGQNGLLLAMGPGFCSELVLLRG